VGQVPESGHKEDPVLAAPADLQQHGQKDALATKVGIVMKQFVCIHVESNCQKLFEFWNCSRKRKRNNIT